MGEERQRGRLALIGATSVSIPLLRFSAALPYCAVLSFQWRATVLMVCIIYFRCSQIFGWFDPFHLADELHGLSESATEVPRKSSVSSVKITSTMVFNKIFVENRCNRKFIENSLRHKLRCCITKLQALNLKCTIPISLSFFLVIFYGMVQSLSTFINVSMSVLPSEYIRASATRFQ